MRLYLDTNILVFLTRRGHDDINRDIYELINDYSNQMLVSTVCVQELIHLYQIEKMHPRKDDSLTNVEDFEDWLSSMNIEVVPVTVKHLHKLATLPLDNDHRDPNDRLIIAQAITDKIPLVSSDRKFVKYEKYGLQFVFNDR